MSIDIEFCSYEQSLALKELGFDEECLWYYTTHGTLIEERWCKHPNKSSWTINAPLKSQAFRFFREKFDLTYTVDICIDTKEFFYSYEGIKNQNIDYVSEEYDTYEEAENACIDKLIELAKERSK